MRKLGSGVLASAGITSRAAAAARTSPGTRAAGSKAMEELAKGKPSADTKGKTPSHGNPEKKHSTQKGAPVL